MPKIACVTMVRNEIDILPTFLQNVAALFDHVVMMDHCSVDGTGDMLRLAANGRDDWHVWYVEEAGYFQEAFCSFAMRWLFQNTDTDVVVFLDADELVNVQTRGMFDAIALACWEQALIGSLPWVSCLPLRPGKPIYHGCEFWRSGSKPTGSKVIVPKPVYDRYPSLRPGLGNHQIMLGERAMPVHVVGQLLHFPLRSLEQMKQKMVTGCLSILARDDHVPNDKHHWFQAMKRLAEDDLDEDDLLGMAASYGETNAAFYRLPQHEIAQAGYAKSHLMIAHETLPIGEATWHTDPWHIMAAAISRWTPKHHTRLVPPRDVRVALKDNRLTVANYGG